MTDLSPAIAIDLSSITLRVTDISTSAKTATIRVSGLGEVEVSNGGTLDKISVEIDEEGDQDAKVFYKANSTMVFAGVPESNNTDDPRVVTVTAESRGVVVERKLSTLLDCTKPVFNSPLFLAVDPEDASSVTIETNVSDALTQITTRYFMSSDGGQSYQETPAGATVTGLDRSKTYNFKVVAKDEFGNEGVAYSNLPSTQAPQTGTVEHLFQGGNAVVSWDGFVPAEGYTIDYYLVDTYKGISQTTNTNYVMENLEDYTEYTVSVRAVGSNGVKSANVSVTFRTPDTTAPVVGTVTISDADDTGAATVSWSGFDDPETGIKSYKLKIGEVSQPLATDLDTTYQASGLSVGTHTVTVTATNGEGLTSTAATAEIDIPAPPPAGPTTVVLDESWWAPESGNVQLFKAPDGRILYQFLTTDILSDNSSQINAVVWTEAAGDPFNRFFTEYITANTDWAAQTYRSAEDTDANRQQAINLFVASNGGTATFTGYESWNA